MYLPRMNHCWVTGTLVTYLPIDEIQETPFPTASRELKRKARSERWTGAALGSTYQPLAL
jgi:hypothetical protein